MPIRQGILGNFLCPTFFASGLVHRRMAGKRVLFHMLSIWLSALVLTEKNRVLSDC